MTNQDLPSSYIFAIIDRFDPQNLFFLVERRRRRRRRRKEREKQILSD
jgi:hypothetical protein